ncbi:MAG: metallophosphoesterase [Clostridiales bacterium]|nr:metallophosphoesterase [Clostridiales bacterium]
MRIALLADIHGNLPALAAALADIQRKHAPDSIVSLGDQVNLGPSPREVLAMLRENGVTCLHGNHERYILSVLRGEPGYDGANFDSLRFNASRLSEAEITFPREKRIGNLILTHALPEDDRFPVYKPKEATLRLAQMAFPEGTHILCGHGHNPTHLRVGGVTVDSIGAAGCMDDGVPGTASYTILDIEKDGFALRPFLAPYDPRALRPLFRESGMADFCPVMAHIACVQMERQQDILVPFVTQARRIAAAKGEQDVSHATWRETDASFPWPGGVGTAAFWRA